MLGIATGPELFTEEERGRLAPYFTNADAHVFALTNLPETVKGALFAKVLPVREVAAPALSRRIRRQGCAG